MTPIIGARRPQPKPVIECRGCGCDDDHACVDINGNACAWVLLDTNRRTGICNACAEDADWFVPWMAQVGRREAAA